MTRTSHWLLRFGFVLAAVFIAINSRALRTDVVASCDILCGEGSPVGCAADEHKTWSASAGESPNAQFEVHSTCKPDTCSYYHTCAGFALISPADKATATGDVAALAALLSRESGAVALNADRRAVQVRDCDSKVIANLPVSSAMLAAMQGPTLGS